MLIADRPSSLVAAFPQLKTLLADEGPPNFDAIRDAALARFEAVGLPGHKDEEYRYVSFREVAETQYGLPYGATLDRAQAGRHAMGRFDAITVAFINGQFAPEISSSDVLPNGVFVGTLAEAYEVHPTVIAAHLGKIATLQGKLGSSNDERFVDLNTAFLGEGAFVYVPCGVAVERPIHILWVNQADHGPFALYPRTLVVLEDGATAKVFESAIGREGRYLSNSVTELWLGRGANLEHVIFQDETKLATHISTTAYHQEADSVVTGTNINFGSSLARNELSVWLSGERTETWLNGASLAIGEQVVDNHTRIDHKSPNCNSFEVYKLILDGHATGVFNGKIFVYEDAQKTDAKQTNQAVLLSPNATVDTKPQLEIFADDVKCTHGATVGQLREDALFYLRSRGIPMEEARSLMVYAFAAEVIEKITVPEARAALEALLFERLGAGG